MYGAFINAVAINTCFGTRRDEMANNIKINPGSVGPRGKNLSYLYNKSIRGLPHITSSARGGGGFTKK